MDRWTRLSLVSAVCGGALGSAMALIYALIRVDPVVVTLELMLAGAALGWLGTFGVMIQWNLNRETRERKEWKSFRRR